MSYFTFFSFFSQEYSLILPVPTHFPRIFSIYIGVFQDHNPLGFMVFFRRTQFYKLNTVTIG